MQDKQVTKDNEVQEQLPAWHKPVIMRIEFKRKLQEDASFDDGFIGSGDDLLQAGP